MTTLRQRVEKLYREKLRAYGGCAVPDFDAIESFARSERALARNEALEEAAMRIDGSVGSGMYHAPRIRALKTDAAKEE